MRVAVVSEYYPLRRDPVLGIWAHRQALAAKAAGAAVEVLVLHRPVPSRAALRSRRPRALLAPVQQPLHDELDGLAVTYVPFLAPPRPSSYPSWGRWAAPTLALTLRRLRRRFRFDLVHAHYAAPGGDATRRALTLSRIKVPYVVSVHGGDLLAVAHGSTTGESAVRDGLEGARTVLANSAGMAERAVALGARKARVVHLGTDLPDVIPAQQPNLLVTVANLVDRKRHGDVLRALWLLRERYPDLRWLVVGDGPERRPLERLAAELGLADRVQFRGRVPHTEAVSAAQSGAVFVLPSIDEAFGVAYVEAMAGGVPAIGCLLEPGPEEIARLSEGMFLAPPGDPERLSMLIDSMLSDPQSRMRMGAAARTTVRDHFTWASCGRATVAAYADALADG